MKKKIGLVAGCSHAAGSEIDGTTDSRFNRDHSFGSKLCKMLGYEPVNIAISGSTNSGIARSIIEWFSHEYDSTTEVFVCVGWTESNRIEVPSSNNLNYKLSNDYVDWYDLTSEAFYRINCGWEGSNDYEKRLVSVYKPFMIENDVFLQVTSAMNILTTQYFLKMTGIPYVMCNTMSIFTENKHIQPYLNKIDESCYYNLRSTSNESFYFRYKNLGYTNHKARYWHHDDVPHNLFAQELYTFVRENQNV